MSAPITRPPELRDASLLILGYEALDIDDGRIKSGTFYVLAQTEQGQPIRLCSTYIWQQVYDVFCNTDMPPVWAKVIWQRSGKGGYYKLMFCKGAVELANHRRNALRELLANHR
jgi:hypothetical protein